MTSLLQASFHLDSQVAGNNRPLYPKVDHYWFKVAHNYGLLALQAALNLSSSSQNGLNVSKTRGSGARYDSEL